MDADVQVCYCFHVTKRKILSYIRAEKPTVASRLAECGGAGTGCGWCVPFLRRIFEQQATPEAVDLLTPEEYARRRESYLRGEAEESGGV